MSNEKFSRHVNAQYKNLQYCKQRADDIVRNVVRDKLTQDQYLEARNKLFNTPQYNRLTQGNKECVHYYLEGYYNAVVIDRLVYCRRLKGEPASAQCGDMDKVSPELRQAIMDGDYECCYVLAGDVTAVHYDWRNAP